MRTRRKLREKLTYSNVVSTICLFLLLGGGAAYASGQLAKNSVGAKQLKKNAVTTAKLKNEAVTAAKVKKGALTGAQINVSTLGTVPASQTAQTAQTANALAAAEPWHEVGAPGEPAFQNGWENLGTPGHENAGFFKDHEGIVHLKGTLKPGATALIFQLPPGFRPANGKFIQIAATCSGGPCTEGTFPLTIYGPGVVPGFDGGVVGFTGATFVGLEGVTFRAES